CVYVYVCVCVCLCICVGVCVCVCVRALCCSLSIRPYGFNLCSQTLLFSSLMRLVLCAASQRLCMHDYMTECCMTIYMTLSLCMTIRLHSVCMTLYMSITACIYASFSVCT